jgi:hypothetical protein
MMPFVLPSHIAEGSLEALNLRLQYESTQQGQGGSAVSSMTPLGYQQITNDALASVQQLTVPTGAMIAVIQNNGSQPCRWRDDAGNPTATLGRVIAADDDMTYTGNLSALKFIRAADGVTLDISFYK